jgi:hypothetical protein
MKKKLNVIISCALFVLGIVLFVLLKQDAVRMCIFYFLLGDIIYIFASIKRIVDDKRNESKLLHYNHLMTRYKPLSVSNKELLELVKNGCNDAFISLGKEFYIIGSNGKNYFYIGDNEFKTLDDFLDFKINGVDTLRKHPKFVIVEINDKDPREMIK